MDKAEVPHFYPQKNGGDWSHCPVNSRCILCSCLVGKAAAARFLAGTSLPCLGGPKRLEMADPVVSGMPETSGEDQGSSVQPQIFRKGFSMPKLVVKEAPAKIRAKAISSRKVSKAEEKDTRRRQNAMDKRFTQAEREADQRRGENPHRGERVVISCVLPAQLLNHLNDARQQMALCSQTWSPDGVTEQSS